MRRLLATLLLISILNLPAVAKDHYHSVTYPPSTKPGELPFGVTFTVWIPEGAQTLRGVIVHQHGCGSGACKGGATAAYDLHWQALAKKWDCALLGPSYHQEDGQNCRLWCDPRNGSRTAFLQCLKDLAAASKHPELETVPWCLWGHSGGGFWASLMMASDPERVIAAWLRSGTAYSAWTKGEIPKPTLSEAAFQIPIMCNPGVKEKEDKRFSGAWTGGWDMFKAYRAKGAPIGFAPDPRTSHECGDSRYLAIPFFDVCLSARLPAQGTKLRAIDPKKGWRGIALTDRAMSAESYTGDPTESVWLPDQTTAKAWMEYVKTGAVSDSTAPPAPTDVHVQRMPDGSIEVSWKATADFESGLRNFVIYRDDKPLTSVPEKPVGRFGRPLFQQMSYHDTPEKPLPKMAFIDRKAGSNPHKYQVSAVNGVGLESTRSSAAILKN